MAKRRTTRRAKRQADRAQRAVDMAKPSGKSKYGLKNRHKEIARGYSTRPNSPFYLPESQR